MPAWPDLSDYHEALQNPQRSFADPALQQAAVEQDRFGMPRPATGANAVVYKATHRREVWAVRCFLRPITDHAERYAAISDHLARAKVPYATRFHYLRQGIRIKGEWFPLVKMEWVQGVLLDREVERLLERPRELANLRGRWRTLARDLEAARIAHGDLQHGNVLAQNGKLLLVDYDGMWVPSLSGRKATETGHRAYQHPRRGEAHFGPWLDRFSALVVYLSLAALEKDPGLWEDHYTGDNLLFVREDFVEVGRSPIWSRLAGLGPDLQRLAGVLAAAAGREPKDVPTLEDVVARPGKQKALKLDSTASPPPKKPRWASAPPSRPPVADAARDWNAIWARPGERLESRWRKFMVEEPVTVVKEVEVTALDPLRSALAVTIGLGAGAALAVAVSPALGLLAAGGGLAATRRFARRRKVKVKVQSRRKVQKQEHEEHTVVAPGLKSAVMAVALAPDARRLLAVSRLGECGAWDLPDGEWRPMGARLPPFQQAALARSLGRLALATERAALVFDLPGGNRTELPADPGAPFHAVALSPDGSTVALGQAGAQVRVIEVRSGRVAARLTGQGSRIGALAFSADGQYLMLGTEAGAAQMARLLPRLETVAEERSHRAAVTAVAVAGKGELFASADEGGTVAIYGRDGKRRATSTVGSRGVRSLCFAGDGPWALVAGCGDGTVKVIDPGKGTVVASHAAGSHPVTCLDWGRDRMALAAGDAAGRVTLLAVEG
jgi:hypothetical protein